METSNDRVRIVGSRAFGGADVASPDVAGDRRRQDHHRGDACRPAYTPVITTAYIVRDFGYMIYDTLLAKDSSFKIQPQMAD